MGAQSLSQQPESRLLGREAAANYLDMTTRSLDRLVDRGIITPVRIAGVRRTFFDRADLDALIDGGKLRNSSALGEQAIQVRASEMVDAQA